MDDDRCNATCVNGQRCKLKINVLSNSEFCTRHRKHKIDISIENNDVGDKSNAKYEKLLSEKQKIIDKLTKDRLRDKHIYERSLTDKQQVIDHLTKLLNNKSSNDNMQKELLFKVKDSFLIELESFSSLLKNNEFNKEDVYVYINSCIKNSKMKIRNLGNNICHDDDIIIPDSLKKYINDNKMQGSNEDKYINLFKKLYKITLDSDIELELIKYKSCIENSFIDNIRLYIVNNYSDIDDLMKRFEGCNIDKTKKTLSLLLHPDKVRNEAIKDECVRLFRDLNNQI